MKRLDFTNLVGEEEATVRYNAACHAMQSGVAMKMGYDAGETTPKHLRVGVNSAMVDSAALAELLMHKGVISSQEYLNALMQGMEREVELYKEVLSERFHADIDLR